MRHLPAAIAATTLSLALALPCSAQTTDATTLQAGAQLVVVDVVVQDKDGHPVHGLKAENFQVLEDKVPQSLRSIEEHKALSAPNRPDPPIKLPPGTFTNYTPIRPDETLNVLLLDSLNTPTKDQTFVRNQLAQFVRNAPAGTRLAIFGLTTHLIFLQSFTSDPEVLKDAVERKLIPRGSVLLDDPNGTNSQPESLSDQLSTQAENAPAAMAATLAEVAANVADFEAQNKAFQTGLRAQYTLDAFNTLGHYLSSFPGRKNVIWFSGSFPITLLPDPDAKGSPFAGVETKSEEFQKTSALLSRAQVAVYPLDARGLTVNAAFDAASQGPSSRNPRAFLGQLNKNANAENDEHSTMSQLAEATGGHAFYNTNDLASAVAKAIDAGSNFYTLTYSPTNHKQDGGFRTIHVNLSGADLHTPNLSYRRGYFAEDARKPTSAASNGATPSGPGAPAKPADANAQHDAQLYATAAMTRGGPTPQELLFKVRVLPATTTTETTLAPDNKFGPYKLPGPYQRFLIDFVALPTEFALPVQPDGRHAGRIEFIAYDYTADGQLINSEDRIAAISVSPTDFPRFLKGGLQYRLELSSPIKTETYLRIAVRDMLTNRFGVVEIPASTVSHLPPPPQPPDSPSSPPATPGPATTTSSNPVTPATAPSVPPH